MKVMWRAGWNAWKHWLRLFLKASEKKYKAHKRDLSYLKEIPNKSEAWRLGTEHLRWAKDPWWMLGDAIQHPNMMHARKCGDCDDFAYLAYHTFGTSLRHKGETFLFSAFYFILAEKGEDNHMICVYKSSQHFMAFSNQNCHMKNYTRFKQMLMDYYHPEFIAKIDAKLNIIELVDWYNFRP